MQCDVMDIFKWTIGTGEKCNYIISPKCTPIFSIIHVSCITFLLPQSVEKKRPNKYEIKFYTTKIDAYLYSFVECYLRELSSISRHNEWTHMSCIYLGFVLCAYKYHNEKNILVLISEMVEIPGRWLRNNFIPMTYPYSLSAPQKTIKT